MADGCCELSKMLLERLNGLGLLSTQSGSLLHRGKAAWRWVWSKKETEEIAERLHYFGSQLALHLTYQIKQNQLEQRTWQLSKDDIQTVLARTNDVLLSVNDLKLGIEEKLDKQHEDVLRSIGDLRLLNSQLQVQTTQEVSSASRASSEGISNLEASFSALMLKQNEDMRTYNSEILESLAIVRVENSKLHGRVTQVLPQACSFDNTSLKNLLGSMLDEYQESFISEIRKEFRGTARSEMKGMRAQALQAIDTIQPDRQTRNLETQTTTESAVEPPYPYASEPMQNAEKAPTELGERQRQEKDDIAIIYTKQRFIETRMGIFSLIILDKVIFDPVKPPVSVYELTTHFTPSPRWCSKGFFVAYQKVADARGTPKFGLQLESYRVLDRDHHIWEAIKKRDIEWVRSMLDERVISPDDRNEYSQTVLMVSSELCIPTRLINANVDKYAVLGGNLDIVKALVHSGANINAVDR